MTSISKYVYSDKLDDLVNEHNNAYHCTIKLKPGDVTSSAYIDFAVENNKDPEYKVDDYVRISNYQFIFAKHYTPNLPEKVFIIKNLKILYYGHM